jgi:hypothetical protein
MCVCVCLFVCLFAYVININFCQDDSLYLKNYILLIQDRENIACVVDLQSKLVNLSFISLKVMERKFCLLKLHFSGKNLHCCCYAV